MQNETTFANNSQKQTFCFAVLSVVHIEPVCPWDESKTPQDFRGRSQSRSSLSGTAASGKRRGWNVFWLQQVDTSGWKTSSIFLLAFTTALNLLNLCHIIAFSSLAANSPTLLFPPPDPYTKLLPGGCCSRNEVQAFDPAPDHWLKGCHFSFRPLSIPRQLFISKPGRHTSFFFFLSHSYILYHMTSSFCPLTGYRVRELASLWAQIPKLIHNTGKAIWHLLCWNWIEVNVCFSAHVRHNMMAAYAYTKTTQAHITYLRWVKVKFTVKDKKKNMPNHFHEGKNRADLI